MSQESIQTIFIGVIAVLLGFQTIVLVLIARFAARVRKPFEEFVDNASATTRIMRHRAECLDLALAQMDQKLRDRVEQADAVAQEVLERSHLQALAAEKLVCDLLDTIEFVVRETERTVKMVMREARALNAGARAAVGYFFSRDR
jgi:hypothetical protein